MEYGTSACAQCASICSYSVVVFSSRAVEEAMYSAQGACGGYLNDLTNLSDFQTNSLLKAIIELASTILLYTFQEKIAT